MKLNIGFVGLTHLGICSLASASFLGANVIGYDDNIEKIEKIRSNKNNVFEPNLQKILKKNSKRISFTEKFKDILNSDIVYLSEDIPTNQDGKSNTKSLENYLKLLIKTLPKKTPIIILSQVKPGFTREYYKSKKEIYYQVETLVFGKAMERALKPERIIIGVSNKNKTKINKFYLNFLKLFNTEIIKMKFESAELSKIAINAFLVSTVTTTNILSMISEKINADWNDIVPALKKDRRIGQYAYLKPGLGISGGNLERDLYTIKQIVNNNSLYLDFVKIIRNISRDRKNWPYNTFKKILKKYKLKKPKIGVLGLSYKENTNSIKNSPSIKFLERIIKTSSIINVHDPIIKQINFPYKLHYYSSINSLILKSDIILILTPWNEFKVLNQSKNFNILRNKFVIDPFGIINNKNSLKISTYYKLGIKYV